MTNAFNSNVPREAQDKILALATLGAGFVANLGGDTFGDDAISEPVEWQSRDGFASRNDGGYYAQQWYACGYGSGTYRSNAEREEMERMEANAERDYRRDNDIEPDAELTEEQQEAQSEYEMGYMEDQATIAEFEVFVIRDSGEVQCSMLLHYKDAPYHRPKYAEEVYVKSWPMAEFMTLDNAAIMADVQKAYDLC